MKSHHYVLITVAVVFFFLLISQPALSHIPSGDLAPLGNPDGQVNVGDALIALRFALNLEPGHPTTNELSYGDVAPLDDNDQPNPDGQITVGDALVILRKALDLVNWETFDFSALSPACNLSAVKEAAVYTQGPGPHPIVLLSEGKKHKWYDCLPCDWIPVSVATTELVACLLDDRKLIETCNYTGLHTVYRYKHVLEIAIISAHTGTIIDNHTFYGGRPRLCKVTETFWGMSLTKSLYGTDISFYDVQNWLNTFVDSSYRGNVVAAIDAPGPSALGLAFDGTYVWCADNDDDKIYKLDTAGNIIEQFDSPGSSPQGLAFDGTYLWVSDQSDDKIYKLDTSGNIIDFFDSPGYLPVGLAFDGKYLWHTDWVREKIYKLDTVGNIIDDFDSPGSRPRDCAFDGMYVWCADSDDEKIYQLDTAGRVVNSFVFPGSSPQGLAFDGTYLWCADASDDKIYKLDTAGFLTKGNIN